MAWSFVCPASRGIGFALARHLLQTTSSPVVATARRDIDGVKSSILSDLPGIDAARLTVLELDVTDEASIAAAAARARSLFPPPAHHLRLALALPGVLLHPPEKAPAQIDARAALDTFRINAVGPLLLIKHFSPFLPRKQTPLAPAPSPSSSSNDDGNDDDHHGDDGHGFPPHAVWAAMSARVGSTADNALGGWYAYRASKAAVNSLTKTFDLHLRNAAGAQAMAVALHPGTVRTALSRPFWSAVRPDKLFTPDFAAQKLLQVLRRLPIDRGRGRCWDWSGKEIPP